MGVDSSSLRDILDAPLLSREDVQRCYGTDRHLRRLLDRTLAAVEVVVDSPLLSGHVAGVFLFGSAVAPWSGKQPSDVDVLIILGPNIGPTRAMHLWGELMQTLLASGQSAVADMMTRGGYGGTELVVGYDDPLFWEDAEAMLDVGQARYGADYRFVRIR